MTAKFLNGINANSKRITSVADATAADDAVTLAQLQAYVRGLDWKDSVRAATTTNGTLASAFANGSTVDGVTLATNDRVLLKNQSSGAENGIYKVNASGAPTRVVDADVSAEVTAGMAVYVTEGTVNGDTAWVLTTNDPITLGTTALVFAQFGGGTAYTGGAGLVLTGTSFAVGAGTGIIVNADDVAIDTAVVVRKYAANCVATTNPQTFAHGLGTADLAVAVYESGVKVYPDVSVDSTNVTVDWGGAPSAAQYRVVAKG